MKTRVLSSLFFTLLAFTEPANAELKRVNIDVVSLPLAEVMDALSLMSGIPVTTIGKPKGTVERWAFKGDGVSAFEALAEIGNLFVAFDGSRMIVSPRSEATTTVFDGTRGRWPEIKSSMKILFPRYPKDSVQYDQVRGTVIVRGPSEFAQAIGSIVNRPSQKIKFFKGAKVEVLDLGPE